MHPMDQLTLPLHFPASVIPTGRADGAVLVVPGKAVLMERELTVKEVARLSGYTPRRIQQLARTLGARQRQRGCKLRIPASAVAQMLEGRA